MLVLDRNLYSSTIRYMLHSDGYETADRMERTTTIDQDYLYRIQPICVIRSVRPISLLRGAVLRAYVVLDQSDRLARVSGRAVAKRQRNTAAWSG